MANQRHLDILTQGVEVWNQWRKEHVNINLDLSEAYLSEAYLSGANLSGANLSEAYLSGANLSGANLSEANLDRANLDRANLDRANLDRADLGGANLSGANLSGAGLVGAYLSEANLSDTDLGGAYLIGANLDRANLSGADLSRATLVDADLHQASLIGANLIGAHLNRANFTDANLTDANLSGAFLSRAYLTDADLTSANLTSANLTDADLTSANFTDANLTDANLSSATLVGTNLTDATLTQCTVYGISVWNVQLVGARQENLVITHIDEPAITVDNLEVAQFIYLLLNNTKIRDIINTITTKAVLILGRFTPERTAVLDALRNELRKLNYTPILFDFEKPVSRDFTETVRTLAHLARFIIADLTDPSSIPQELQAIVPDLEVPVQPVLLEAKREYSMFVDFRKYHWVLPIYLYKDQASLIASLQKEIIEPAEKKARELAIEKAKRLERP